SWWGQLGQTPQILNNRRQRELVAGTAEPAQPQAVKLEDSLEVREQYLDLLALTARAPILLSGSESPRHVAGRFMNAARELAHRCVRAAALVDRADGAV